ncbi:hypothetical protein A0H81_08036 [Grifola frondosa]|uniref:Uncharacterized protein n=1 Tax=Grifola frondosa TaxID=5627 RepID=A0A1C7M5L6_GRIFR|nr:hypothetical protein A0H81_08036 [Grifola frondosa]
MEYTYSDVMTQHELFKKEWALMDLEWTLAVRHRERSDTSAQTGVIGQSRNHWWQLWLPGCMSAQTERSTDCAYHDKETDQNRGGMVRLVVKGRNRLEESKASLSELRSGFERCSHDDKPSNLARATAEIAVSEDRAPTFLTLPLFSAKIKAMISAVPVYLAVAAFAPLASAHIDVLIRQPSHGAVDEYDFDEWWFHGHLGYPPNDGNFFELPAGGTVNSELSCDKGATSWFASSPGGDAGFGSNWPCPGQPSSEFHTTGLDDVTGCGLAIAYKSDVNSIQPEDFAIFTVNHTCVWTLNTAFQVPADMPACPEGGCHCAWFWIHSPDSGSEQNYMNGFKCQVTGATGTKAIGTPGLPRRCGADPNNGHPNATPGNCTIGPKQPFYWYQNERNNMFEGTYAPPSYNQMYGYADGAQNDIFQEPYIASEGPAGGASTTSASTTSTSASTTSTAIPTSTAVPSTSATSTPSSRPSSIASSAPPPSSTSSSSPSSSSSSSSSVSVSVSVSASASVSASSATTSGSSSSSSSPVPSTTTHVHSDSGVTSAATTITLKPITTTLTPSATATRKCKPRPTTPARRDSIAKRKHARRLHDHAL